MSKIIFSPEARKKFRQLPQSDKEEVARAIAFLERGQGSVLNIKRLRTANGKWLRIRVGNLRIIYEAIDSEAFFVSTIDYRGSIY